MSLAARFRDTSVSAKLIGAFSVVVIVTSLLGLFAVQRLSEVDASAQDIRSNWMVAIGDLGRFQYNVTRFRTAEGATLLTVSNEQRQDTLALMDKYVVNAREAWTHYSATIQPGHERELADNVAAAWADYQSLRDKLYAEEKSGGAAAAGSYYIGPMRDSFNKLTAAIEADVAFNTESGNVSAANGARIFESARLWIFVALGAVIFICIGACFALMRSISQPLVKMTEAMGELAAGNLAVEVPNADQQDEVGRLAEAMTAFKNQLAAAERSKAEQTEVIVSSVGKGLEELASGNLAHRVTADLAGPFSKLKEDFNKALTRLQDTMKNVLTSTDGISNGASEISQAADDLSRRTEQQAASLEETAAALEEITATVKKTATNSREASSSVGAAKQAADEGGQVVESAIKAMDQIEQSSKQITDIIGVIDEIAFQTNLLALNAGVEAARAGDAGKGFAVVASEVRALAQRSSEAAKEIKSLIKASSEHVGAGVRSVGESGEALKRIVSQVMQINTLINEMAQAAEQQSSGIEQVNAAVGQMDQVTQQNAAMVEQSTAATRHLAAETQSLTELVGFFRVGEVARNAPVRRAAPDVSVKVAAVKAGNRAKPAAKLNGSGGRQAAVAVARRPSAEPQEDWTEF